MLPDLTTPVSLRRLLDSFDRCPIRPSFVVCTGMVTGMIAQAWGSPSNPAMTPC